MTIPFYAELCVGAGAVFLELFGLGRPLVGYRGGKRWLARRALEALGTHSGAGADRVLLCDPGPWGWAWPILLDPDTGPEVARILRTLQREDPVALWHRLAEETIAPDIDRAELAAKWLCLQAGSAKGRPVDLVGDGWRHHGFGHLSRLAIEKGFTARYQPRLLAQRVDKASGGMARWRHFGCGRTAASVEKHGRHYDPAVLATRCDRLRRVADGRVSVYHGSCLDIAFPDDMRGARVFLDPPYKGTSGYDHDLADDAEEARERLIGLALDLARRGAVVAVSEGEELPLDGWHVEDVTGLARRGSGREVLHVSRAPVARQVSIFGLQT